MDVLKEKISEIVQKACEAAKNGDWSAYEDMAADKILTFLPQWISAEDKAPEGVGYVMCLTGKGNLPYFAMYDHGFLLEGEAVYPRWWMPLDSIPQPPRGDQK